MRQVTYWKCNAKVSAKVIAAIDEWAFMLKEAEGIAKSIGAVSVYCSTSFGSPCVVGFKFKGTPTVKGLCRLKNTGDGYRPRVGTDLDKKLQGFVCKAPGVIRDLLGIDDFDNDDGLFVNAVGWAVRGKDAYIMTRGKPTKGCKRISDVEYERIKRLR